MKSITYIFAPPPTESLAGINLSQVTTAAAYTGHRKFDTVHKSMVAF